MNASEAVLDLFWVSSGNSHNHFAAVHLSPWLPVQQARHFS